MKCLLALLSIPIALGIGQVSSTYSSDDFGSLKVAGACSVTAEHISCWDPSGKPDASMSKDIDKFFSTRDIPLNLKFKKRNRLIVLRHEPKQDAITHFRGELFAPNGQRLKQSVSFAYHAAPFYS